MRWFRFRLYERAGDTCAAVFFFLRRRAGLPAPSPVATLASAFYRRARRELEE